LQALLIEDDLAARTVMQSAFELVRPDVEVVSASKAIEGIEMCKLLNPDVVIMDLGLPDMDGFDIIRQIRSFTDVPIVIASARDIDEIPKEILQMGHIEYFAKPFDLGGFMRRLGSTIESTSAKSD